MIDEVVRKQALSDWLRDRATIPPTPAQIEKHRRLFTAFNEFVSKHDAWIVSVPSSKVVRIECKENSALPIRLAERGFKLTFLQPSTRIVGGAIIPVSTFEMKLPGA